LSTFEEGAETAGQYWRRKWPAFARYQAIALSIGWPLWVASVLVRGQGVLRGLMFATLGECVWVAWLNLGYWLNVPMEWVGGSRRWLFQVVVMGAFFTMAGTGVFFLLGSVLDRVRGTF